MAERIVLLRDGRIEQQGAPLDLYQRPATRYVAGFLGSPPMNFVDPTLVAHEGALALRLGNGTVLALPAARTQRLGELRELHNRPVVL